MTRGPGRSDCCRVGVTYGYRECLREGRVRVKAATQVRRPSVARRTCAELYPMQKTLIQSVLLVFEYLTLRAKTLRGVSWRPYIEKESL